MSALVVSAADSVALSCHERITPCEYQIRFDHLAHQFGEGDLRLPTQFVANPAGISQQRIHFGGSKVARIHPDDRVAAVAVDTLLRGALTTPLDVHADAAGRRDYEIPHRMLLTAGDYVVDGLRLLQHQPLRAYVVAGVAPITSGVEVSEVQHGL